MSSQLKLKLKQAKLQACKSAFGAGKGKGARALGIESSIPKARLEGLKVFSSPFPFNL